jgi:hypothetical protein
VFSRIRPPVRFSEQVHTVLKLGMKTFHKRPPYTFTRIIHNADMEAVCSYGTGVTAATLNVLCNNTSDRTN